MLLVLLALLPLDLAAVGAPQSHDGLRIEAVLIGRYVAARLHNDGSAPRDVLVGYTCGGPEPFVAIIDNVERWFQTGSVTCTGNSMRIERLAPGASTLVFSETLILDGAAHSVAVRYAYDDGRFGKLWLGRIQSAALRVDAAQLDVSMRAEPQPGALAVEIIHAWRGPGSIERGASPPRRASPSIERLGRASPSMRFLTRWLGACAGPADTLIVDGVERSFIEDSCDGPVAAAAEALLAGGSFVNRGVIHLPPGPHRVRARYHARTSDYNLVFGSAKGNLGDWTGDVETPEVEVMVR